MPYSNSRCCQIFYLVQDIFTARLYSFSFCPQFQLVLPFTFFTYLTKISVKNFLEYTTMLVSLLFKGFNTSYKLRGIKIGSYIKFAQVIKYSKCSLPFQ